MPFGGRSILLAGDLRQLPPVGDLALYSTNPGNVQQQQGGTLYRLFDKYVLFKIYSTKIQSILLLCRYTFKLTVIVRQAGDENAQFRDELERMALGTFSRADLERWMPRSYENLSAEEKLEWDRNAIMLASEKKDLVSFNRQKLLGLGTPVFKLSAMNSPASGSSFSAEQAEGLHQTLYTARGARVILTKNLWPGQKLVNGSKGTVTHLIYQEGRENALLPALILVQFDEYTGPSFHTTQDRVVPISLQQNSYIVKKNQYSRSQFPLLPGYGFSTHRGGPLK